jgi:hypothetical protein
MKDHIHTIPVLEALREPGHCPFCKMHSKLDQDAVDFIMGPAYMDEDIRDKTNEAGFCEDHLKKLYAVQNRLGAALLIHTHVKQLIKDTDSANPLEKAAGLFRKSESGANRLAGLIEKQQSRCYLCEKADGTFKRYVDTFFYMWHREAELIPLVKAVPGFCIPHYGMLLREAENSLSKKELDSFLSVVIPLQQQAMAKLEGDLDWFIQKFDYRNSDAPWKESKDAIIRAMAMLKGIEV